MQHAGRNAAAPPAAVATAAAAVFTLVGASAAHAAHAVAAAVATLASGSAAAAVAGALCGGSHMARHCVCKRGRRVAGGGTHCERYERAPTLAERSVQQYVQNRLLRLLLWLPWRHALLQPSKHGAASDEGVTRHRCGSQRGYAASQAIRESPRKGGRRLLQQRLHLWRSQQLRQLCQAVWNLALMTLRALLAPLVALLLGVLGLGCGGGRGGRRYGQRIRAVRRQQHAQVRSQQRCDRRQVICRCAGAPQAATPLAQRRRRTVRELAAAPRRGDCAVARR
eukprot:358544-Chlamydomonas_euryale.AAC.1